MHGLLLGLALAGYAVMFGLPAVQRWHYRRKYPPLPAPEGFAVEVESGSRTGYLCYREEGHEARFEWELGGADVVAFVLVPAADRWADVVPWAPDRRAEILERVAREVWRQQCRSCTWRIGDDTIELIESS